MNAPPTINQRALRRALSQFATGVTVITVQRGEVMHGMTANAFSALSLDPPLVLFCVGKRARMARFLDGAEGFVINILSTDQEQISNQFAGQNDDKDDITRLLPGPVAPLIPGALVSLSCGLEELHEGGDHLIVVGRVQAIHEPDGGNARPPLVFHRSRYGSLIPRGRPADASLNWSNDAIRIYHDEWSVNAEEMMEEEYVRAQLW
jgi:3-hydroxy-9,10-secoandrosta-1,3,5(10)-triene-9,17-dione monooxygenase reductase component